jgi:hypothetical protein
VRSGFEFYKQIGAYSAVRQENKGKTSERPVGSNMEATHIDLQTYELVIKMRW